MSMMTVPREQTHSAWPITSQSSSSGMVFLPGRVGSSRRCGGVPAGHAGRFFQPRPTFGQVQLSHPSGMGWRRRRCGARAHLWPSPPSVARERAQGLPLQTPHRPVSGLCEGPGTGSPDDIISPRRSNGPLYPSNKRRQEDVGTRK